MLCTDNRVLCPHLPWSSAETSRTLGFTAAASQPARGPDLNSLPYSCKSKSGDVVGIPLHG